MNYIWLLSWLGVQVWGMPLEKGFRVVGYAASWSLEVQAIQFDKLTHVNYAFVLPTASGGLTAVENPAGLRELVSLAHAKGVSVLISVGGWNGGDDSGFRAMAASPAARAKFVQACLDLVQGQQLDGVDIDWEYPGDQGATESASYTALMKELSTALRARGKLLTAAVVDREWFATGIQPEVFPYVDFLNLMAYDGDDHAAFSKAEGALAYWIGRGLPREKAVLGVPFYGRPVETAYRTLVAANPQAAHQDSSAGCAYNGIETMKKKTALALERGAGIMIWELSQDTRDGTSLLLAIDQEIASRTPPQAAQPVPPAQPDPHPAVPTVDPDPAQGASPASPAAGSDASPAGAPAGSRDRLAGGSAGQGAPVAGSGAGSAEAGLRGVSCQTGLARGEPWSLLALLALGLRLARRRAPVTCRPGRRSAWLLLGGWLWGCGALPDAEPSVGVERALDAAAPKAALPRKLDWRDHNGNYTTPIRNQNGCYGCYADAVVATMESMIEIGRQQPDLDPDLSEQHIVSCIGADGCSGWATAEQALSFVEKAGGVASEADFPYRASNVACSKLPADWKTRASKLVKWERVPKDLDSIKQRLQQGPIIVKINLYADFSSYSGGVYKHAWGGTDSYHFVVIVGYNDDEQCFIVKNDWGTDWGEDTYGITGEKGWVRIGYGESDIQKEEGYALTVENPPAPAVPDPAPSPQPGGDGPQSAGSDPAAAGNPVPSGDPSSASSASGPAPAAPGAASSVESSMTVRGQLGCQTAPVATSLLPLALFLLLFRVLLRRSR